MNEVLHSWGYPSGVLLPVPNTDSYRIRLEPSAPFFAGHYPDFPITPGVIQVESANRAGFLKLAQDDLVIRRVNKARFWRPVRPDEELNIAIESVSESPDGTQVQFAIDIEGERTAGGSTLLGTSAVDLGEFPAEDDLPVDPSLAEIDLRTVLPHRSPILLVDQVDAVRPGECIIARKNVLQSDIGLCEYPTADYGMSESMMLESWCQVAGALALWPQEESVDHKDDVMLLAKFANIDYGVIPRPGQTLRHFSRFVYQSGLITVMEGWAEVDGKLAMRVGNVTFAIRAAEKLEDASETKGEQ